MHPGLLPPAWLVQAAVAAVWLHEGLWCKLLRRSPHEFEVVRAVPRLGPLWGERFLLALGAVEVAIAAWVLSGVAPLACALVQTGLLTCLNTAGITFSRHLIPDPAGMVLKNVAFLLLAWVAAGLPA